MQRIIDATAVAALPAVPSLSGPAGYFTEGSPGIATATRLRAWWANMVQEEMMSVLAAAGITPDTTGSNYAQLLAAINVLISAAGAGTSTGLAAEIARAKAAETQEVARAEGVEATLAGLAANNTFSGTNVFTQPVTVPYATTPAEAMCRGQFSLAGGLASLTECVAGQTGQAMVSFATPCPGLLTVIGARNNADVDANGNYASLYLNDIPGSGLAMQDHTKLSTCHAAAISVAAGEHQATYAATTTSVDFSVMVVASFTPWPL
jgi:hypothetical protein